MTARPILFSGPMVRALLAGTKTQTRRVAKPQPFWVNPGDGQPNPMPKCPYGVPGDTLWLRETWFQSEDSSMVHYRADNDDPYVTRWRPSIHMPRWASRITLEVTGVRVERLCAISEADAAAEGVTQCGDGGWHAEDTGRDGSSPCWDTASGSYRLLWESINGPGSWAANPWVWVVSFRRVTP